MIGYVIPQKRSSLSSQNYSTQLQLNIQCSFVVKALTGEVPETALNPVSVGFISRNWKYHLLPLLSTLRWIRPLTIQKQIPLTSLLLKQIHFIENILIVTDSKSIERGGKRLNFNLFGDHEAGDLIQALLVCIKRNYLNIELLKLRISSEIQMYVGQ